MNGGTILDQGSLQELRLRFNLGYLLIIDFPSSFLPNNRISTHLNSRQSRSSESLNLKPDIIIDLNAYV